MSTPLPPSVDQLDAARLAHWRQNVASGADALPGAILTLEAARQFVSTCGFLLFVPRPQHVSSPAPSFVEAILGKTNTEPTLAEIEQARNMLARLIAEGSAVPLSLLGAPSATPETPDFIVSAATFAYVFTLRGEKAFKQLPSTSGVTKVSPLALNTYNLLLENGPIDASGLAGLLGKEVTETAVLRALTELWQHLRVLPVPHPEGGVTRWETVTNRFTKQLKAGANAGQPSALSALISLYLSQALLATENDIETFLSPLAPRSRVRDVLHALSGARQLESLAVEGKTHLHIHGELPSFGASPTMDAGERTQSPSTGVEFAEDGTRIRKFVDKPRKLGTGYVERAKPFRTKISSDRDARPLDRRMASRATDERPRSGPTKRTFDRPWEEEKRERSARTTVEQENGVSRDDPKLQADSDASQTRTPKRLFGPRPGSGRGSSASPSRPKFGGDRPAFSREREGAGAGRPRERDGAGSRGAPYERRKPYAKAGFDRPTFRPKQDQPVGTRPPEQNKERRPFRRDGAEQGLRPPRGEFGTGRNEGDRSKREGSIKSNPVAGRSGSSTGSGSRPERAPYRKFDAPRGPRKPLDRREGSAQLPRRDFANGTPAPRSGNNSSRGGEADDRGRPKGGFSARTKGGATERNEGSGFVAKRSFGSKVSGSAKKQFTGGPSRRRVPDAPGASTFDKFKGGNKPWGKRPPSRKPRPEEGEA